MLGALFSYLFIVSTAQEPTTELTHTFSNFISDYNRTYANNPKEYQYRLEVFAKNLKRIEWEQKNSPSSVHGINQFADRTRDEYRAFTGYNQKLRTKDVTRVCLAKGVPPPTLDTTNLPDSFDWRDHKPPVVTPVKNQGSCGSCWTFSAIGNIEGQWALAGNSLTSLSEQSIVDCSKGCCSHDGSRACNNGCGGGWQWVAYDDMRQLGGIPSEKDYPYHGRDGKCQVSSKKIVAKIANYTCITAPDGHGADETQMAAWLVKNGPMAFAMDVSPLGSYRSGVWDPRSCSTTNLDHALLIVGYGTLNGKDYWTIKNSWGGSWGESGYLRMIRGRGACGVNNAVNSVVVAK